MKKVMVHYVNTAALCTEIIIKVAPGATVREAEALAARLQVCRAWMCAVGVPSRHTKQNRLLSFFCLDRRG